MEPLRQFDFASIIVLTASLRQYWFQTEAISVPLDFVSAVNDMLHGQQVVSRINSSQARDLNTLGTNDKNYLKQIIAFKTKKINISKWLNFEIFDLI